MLLCVVAARWFFIPTHPACQVMRGRAVPLLSRSSAAPPIRPSGSRNSLDLDFEKQIQVITKATQLIL